MYQASIQSKTAVRASCLVRKERPRRSSFSSVAWKACEMQGVLGLAVRAIDYECGRIPAQLRKAFLAAFAKLTVRGEIERSVARVSDHWPHDTIAVHVRSWEGDDFRRNLYAARRW
ncbi:MAG: hypothetical protein A2Y55_09400 [Actinobacteria bacterium RBG_16_68_12]|nr:MAG: hypothetical protein A2Y55_09400 [Actinobacteria bacterium RBG_16_68_12]